MSIASILLVDDDPVFEKIMGRLLLRWKAKDEFRYASASSLKEARKLIAQMNFQVLFLDLALSRSTESGFQLLEELRKKGSKIEVVVMSSTTSFESVQKALRLGANDYLPKGFSQSEFIYTLDRAIERSRWKGMERRLIAATSEDLDRYRLVGSSSTMKALRESIAKLAPTLVPILIEAETGTGKELVARNLHLRSKDPTSPFVALDCGAIPDSMAESIFFGHERGAFTGADEQRIGVFEQANGGTLFLDEISNLSLEMQNKLLRALQEREIRRVGGKQVINVEFRLISAANQSLEKLVEQRKFKQDLYFRLNVIQLTLAPLRERIEDLPELLSTFLQGKQMESDLLALLKEYSWPGNIRELKNLIAGCLALAGDKSRISLFDVPETALQRISVKQDSSGIGDGKLAERYRRKLAEAERQILLNAYHAFSGNISALARSLELDRSHLHKKLVQYQIHSPKS